MLMPGEIEMKRIIAVFLSFMFCVTLSACAGEQVLTNTGEFENMSLTLTDAEIFVTDAGMRMLKVTADYTNQNEDPYYALCSFVVKAFQEDKELTDCSDINGNEAALIQEVKNGQAIQVSYVFSLSDESQVELYICAPTANQEILGKWVYGESEE